jgi:hypothetical protein
LKPADDYFPDEDELLSYMEAEPAPAQNRADRADSQNAALCEPDVAVPSKQATIPRRDAADGGGHAQADCWIPEASPADEEMEADREEALCPCHNPMDIDGDVMPVTSSSGARVYCALRPPAETSTSLPVRQRPGFLLSQPWSEIEEDQRNRTFDRLIREEEAKERLLLQSTEEQEEASTSGGRLLPNVTGQAQISVVTNSTVEGETKVKCQMCIKLTATVPSYHHDHTGYGLGLIDSILVSSRKD